MSLQQFLNILRVRWMLIAASTLVALALAVWITQQLPRKYAATSQIAIDPRGADPVGGIGLPPQMMPGFMATQVDIANSRTVALHVIDTLGLEHDPAMQARWLSSAQGQGTLRDWLVGTLQRGIEVKPLRESSVLNFTYAGPDPAQSAAIANAFARGYRDITVRMRIEPARETRSFLDTQGEQLRERLEAAQNRLTAYQKAQQITSSDERLDVDTARLSDISAQLTALQTSLTDATRRRDLARASLTRGRWEDVPEVQQSTLIQSLRRDLASLESRVQEQAAVLGTSHPSLIKLQSEQRALRERIEQESTAVVTGLSLTQAALARREADLRAQLETQRSRVLQVRQSRDELALLQRDVEDAQRSYASVTTRRDQTALESKSTQAGGYLLSEAVAPLRPTSPRLSINLAAALILGAGLGGWTAIGLELRRRRIRSADDMIASVEVPVLARIRKLPNKLRKTPARLSSGDVIDVERLLQPLPRTALPAGRTGRVDEVRGEPAISEPAISEAAVSEAAVSEVVPSEPVFSETASATAPGAVQVAARPRKPIGEILRDAGVLSEDDIPTVLSSARSQRKRFGDAAVALGLIKRIHVKQALAFQFDHSVILPGRSEVSREVISAYESTGVTADFRKLRTQLLARWIRPRDEHASAEQKAFTVISPSRGDGKTFIATNLAVTFSQMGLRTLLIDGDLRNGRVHEVFGMDNREGLSSVLCGSELAGALQRIEGLKQLVVMTAGAEAPNPGDLLSRERLEFLLGRLEPMFEVIVIDTPNTAEDPDAEQISICARGCLLVGRADHTSFESMGLLAEEVKAMGVTVIGTAYVDA